MSIVDETSSETTSTRRTPAIYPRLAYSDERAALEYLQRVFGFTEIRESRMEWQGQILAWLRLGEGVVMIGHANHDVHHLYSPAEVGHATAMVNAEVADIDAHYEHAVTEGADITMEIEDAFYGYRRYEATDLDGHRWHFTESFDSIRARGGTVAEDIDEDC